MAKYVTGGKRARQFVRKAKTAQGGIRSIEIGFYGDNRHPETGVPMSNLAAFHEFGTSRVPQRPFMRPGIEAAKPDVVKLLRDKLNSRDLTVGSDLADGIGRTIHDSIGDAIERVNEPPNHPVTIENKDGDNPLLDTRGLRDAIEYRTRG